MQVVSQQRQKTRHINPQLLGHQSNHWGGVALWHVQVGAPMKGTLVLSVRCRRRSTFRFYSQIVAVKLFQMRCSVMPNGLEPVTLAPHHKTRMNLPLCVVKGAGHCRHRLATSVLYTKFISKFCGVTISINPGVHLFHKRISSTDRDVFALGRLCVPPQRHRACLSTSLGAWVFIVSPARHGGKKVSTDGSLFA